MRNYWKIGLLAMAAVGIAFAAVTTVSAHDEPPFEPSVERPDGRFHRHGPLAGKGPLSEYREIMHEALSSLLGMSPEELAAERAEGRMLHELVAEAGVELAELRDVMRSARAEMIEAALDDGVLTEEQAQRMLERAGPRGHGPGHRHPPCDGEGPHKQGQDRWNGGS